MNASKIFREQKRTGSARVHLRVQADSAHHAQCKRQSQLLAQAHSAHDLVTQALAQSQRTVQEKTAC
jgi:hypothetical protein